MKRKRIKCNEISLDEIFLDSKNIPGFDTERFEGRIEKSLEKKIFLFANLIFLLVLSLILSRVFYLQIIKGEELKLRARNNHLKTIPIFSPRGVIYDRNGEQLAWNAVEKSGKNQSEDYGSFSSGEIIDSGSQKVVRRYNKSFRGLSHIIGYVGYPSEEDKENGNTAMRDLRDYKIGKAGVEKYYNNVLRGEVGYKLIEMDSLGSVISKNIQKESGVAKPVILTVDAELNSKVYQILEETAKERKFKGGSAVIIDVNTGEVLAMTNFPEYDNQILSKGDPYSDIEFFLNNPMKPFLNRAISGLYSPGSTIKPLIALAALNEHIIDADEIIETHGSISLPNPYFPDKKSVFYDWKDHGPVDMRRALAVSSNVYFYTIGGGYGNIKGLGINAINKYANMFNFGAKTGIDLFGEQKGLAPSQKQKSGDLNDPVWRIGDTYNASIGQGNFQVTPVQMAVFAAAIANDGIILKPKLTKFENSGRNELKKVNIKKEFFKIVKEGMRLAVLEGTAKALNGIGVSVAGKTGTAEIGSGKYVNSWFIGFFPYENPRFAVSIVLESGDAHNLIGAPFAARRILEWMKINTPEYLFTSE
jgi:penicillin-binding protein 2